VARKPLHTHLAGLPVLTSTQEAAAAGPFDVILLAVPSPALREGTWLTDLLAACPDALFIPLQLTYGDKEWLTEVLGGQRFCQGFISIISFAAPLGSLKVAQPGTAYFIPPLAPSPYTGPTAARPLLQELAEISTKGGLYSTVVDNIDGGARLPDAALFALVSALELVGWRFDGLKDGDAFPLGLAAAQEREAIFEATGAGPPPAALKFLTPTTSRLILCASAKVMPLPLEDFIRVHFIKVNKQFQEERRRIMAEGEARGVPTPRIKELHERLAHHNA
jgi:2-dehydropantoate 2-reductase